MDGIECRLSAADFEDYEVLEALGTIVDEDATDEAKMAATVRMYRTAFGEDFGRIKRELRERGGGRLTAGAMNDFFLAAMEAVGAKNS